MENEERYYKVIKRALESEDFVIDGFKYIFKNIKPIHNALQMDIEVVLPKPGQSWVASKFSWDIHNILENIQRYIGKGFSVSFRTLIDGYDVEELGYCFVNPEKEKEIISVLNRKMGKFETRAFSSKSDMTIDFSYRKRGDFYELDGDYLNFYLTTHTKNIRIDGQPVKPDLHELDHIAGTIYEKIMDSDFRSEIEGLIYEILEPEIKIHNVDDCYIQAFTRIDSIDGLPTSQNEAYYDFVRSWFT